MSLIKNYVSKINKLINNHIFTLKYYDNYHKQTIIKLIVILVMTVYVSNNFKLNKYLMEFIDSYKILRLLAVYILCLTYVTSNDSSIAVNDLVVAAIVTFIFILLIQHT